MMVFHERIRVEKTEDRRCYGKAATYQAPRRVVQEWCAEPQPFCFAYPSTRVQFRASRQDIDRPWKIKLQSVNGGG